MYSYRLRSLSALLINVLLILIISYINHTLSPQSVYIYIDGLFIIFVITHFGFKAGFWILLLTGLFRDAYSIFPFGMSSSLYLIAYTTIRLANTKLRHDLFEQNLAISLIINAFLFTTISIIHSISNGLSFHYLASFLLNFILSEFMLFLTIKWFFNFQQSIPALLGITAKHE